MALSRARAGVVKKETKAEDFLWVNGRKRLFDLLETFAK